MKLLAWIGLAAIVISASFGSGYTYAQQRADTQSWRATQESIAQRDTLRIIRDSVRVDSVEITKLVTRWRTVRDSLVDTLVVTDTVREIVRVANETADACLRANGRCSEALAVAERAAKAEQDAHRATQRSLTMTTVSLDRAKAKSWQHRLEGVVVCGAAARSTGSSKWRNRARCSPAPSSAR